MIMMMHATSDSGFERSRLMAECAENGRPENTGPNIVRRIRRSSRPQILGTHFFYLSTLLIKLCTLPHPNPTTNG